MRAASPTTATPSLPTEPRDATGGDRRSRHDARSPSTSTSGSRSWYRWPSPRWPPASTRAWNGRTSRRHGSASWPRPTVSPPGSWLTVRAARHSGHQSGERVRDRTGRAAQRRVRCCLGTYRRRAGRGGGQGAGDVGSIHLLGLDGHDPGHGLGLSRSGWWRRPISPSTSGATSTRRRPPVSISP